MVVMDYVAGKSAASAQDVTMALPTSVLDDIRRAKDILHDAGLVHGDLRRPNILIWKDGNRRKASGELRESAMLVDFDWAGRAGNVNYPHNLNDKIGWPKDVTGGGPILKEHDDFMFDQL